MSPAAVTKRYRPGLAKCFLPFYIILYSLCESQKIEVRSVPVGSYGDPSSRGEKHSLGNKDDYDGDDSDGDDDDDDRGVVLGGSGEHDYALDKYRLSSRVGLHLTSVWWWA